MTRVARSASNEREGQFSPDGQWLAYQSDESGRYEIYAQRFPDGTDKVLLSQAGGSQVRWRADGRELFYLDLKSRLTAVPIAWTADGRPEPGPPVPLFEARVGGAVHPVFRWEYDVARDGQKFLMNTAIDDSTDAPISVVIGWNRP